MPRWAPAFLFVLTLAFEASLEAQEVRIERHAELSENHYSIEPGQPNCQRISWYISYSGINAGIADVRVLKCTMPMDAQMALHARIFAVALDKEPALQTVFLGRLGRFPEHAQRLALAAKESAEWNPKTGRLKKVSRPLEINLFVQELVRRKDVLAEWQRLLAPNGQWNVTVSGVEEVTVSRAADVPSLELLRRKGAVADGDRLPVDCLVWLKLRRVIQEPK
jgi:hypothetical protein